MTTRPTSRSSQVWTGLAVCLALVGFVRFSAAGFLPAFAKLSGDFAATFPTAYFARLRPDFSTAVVWEGWNYGPMFHFLTLPLFLAPSWSAVPKIWATFNAGMVALSFAMCCRLSGTWRNVSKTTIVMLAGLWLLFQPLATCFAQGNIELLEMAMLLAALALLERRKEGATGLLVGIATMIKFLPVGFLVWLAVRRRWRAAAMGAAAVAATVLLTTVTIGWDTSTSLRAMRQASDVPIVGMHELSVASALMHRLSLMDQSTYELFWFPSARRTIGLAAGEITSLLLAISVGLAVWLRRRRPVTPAEIGVLFMTMFMIQPWNHDYYYVFALFPLSMLFLRAVAGRDVGVIALVVVAYLLMSPPVPYALMNRLALFPIPFAYVVNFYDLPVIGGLLLWATVTARMFSDDDTQASLATKISLLVLGAVVCVGALSSWPRAERASTPTRVQGPAVTLDLQASGRSRIAISPDGVRIAYVGVQDGVERICVRTASDSTSACVHGSEGAADPFFSPDGGAIAFFAGGELRRAPATGGAVSVICPAAGGRTGSWSDAGTILFSGPDGVERVAAAGGPSQTVIRRDAQTESAFLWPEALPGGNVLLGVIAPGGTVADSRLAVHVMTTGVRQLLAVGGQPHYDRAAERLIYARSGALLSAPFDARRLTIGPATSFADRASVTADAGTQFAVAENGTIAYAIGGPQPVNPATLVWLDRRGHESPLPLPTAGYAMPRLSSDGRSLVVAIRDVSSDLWLYDLDHAAMRRLTFDHSVNTDPSWVRGTTHVSYRTAGFGIPRPILRMLNTAPFEDMDTWEGKTQNPIRPSSWGPLGVLAGTQFRADTKGDIWLFGPSWQRPDERFLAATSANEQAPAMSPDGQWVAYTTDASGRNEIVVRTVSGEGEAWPVSTTGGDEPIWAASGREIFFRSGDAVLAVSVSTDHGFKAGTPQVLFRGPYEREGAVAGYDVSRDGNRFVMVRPVPEIDRAVTLRVLEAPSR